MAATALPAAESADARVLVDVGPLKVSIRKADLEWHDPPSVEALVEQAWSVFPSKVEGWHGTTAMLERYAIAKKAVKAQREAARFAVLGTTISGRAGVRMRRTWVKPDGKTPYKMGELGPLVTAVRSALVADIRKREAAQKKADREQARVAAKNAKARERMTEKLLAKHGAAHAGFALPLDVKLSKAVSKDETKKAITHAHLIKHGSQWEVVCTDSYQLTVIPVEPNHPAALEHVKGGYHVIPDVALQAIDKAGGFRVDESGAVVPCQLSERTLYIDEQGRETRGYSDHRVAIPHRVDVGAGYMPPKLEGSNRFDAVKVYGGKRKVKNFRTGRQHTLTERPLIAELPPDKHRIEVTLNARLLAEVAAAVGSKGSVASVTLAIDARHLAKQDNGVRKYDVEGTLRQLHVLPTQTMAQVARKSPVKAGVRAVQMPVRSPR